MVIVVTLFFLDGAILTPPSKTIGWLFASPDQAGRPPLSKLNCIAKSYAETFSTLQNVAIHLLLQYTPCGRRRSNMNPALRRMNIKSAIIHLIGLWLIFLPAVALLGWSLATYARSRHDLKECRDRIHDGASGFEGNADAYGLGIRLGIYLQWTAQTLANFLLPADVAHDTAAAVVAFDVALAIATLLLTFRRQCTFTVELYLILFIFWGSLLVIMAPPGETAQAGRILAQRLKVLFRTQSKKESLPPKSRPKQRDRPVFKFFAHGSNIAGTLAMTTILVYGIWFFDAQSRHPNGDFPDTPGGGSFFLFGKTAIDNEKANKFLLALSSYTLLISPPALIVVITLDAGRCLLQSGDPRGPKFLVNPKKYLEGIRKARQAQERTVLGDSYRPNQFFRKSRGAEERRRHAMPEGMANDDVAKDDSESPLHMERRSSDSRDPLKLAFTLLYVALFVL